MSEKLVNFKIDSDKYGRVFSLARELHGHGGIKKLYNELTDQFLQKYDGKRRQLEEFFGADFISIPQVNDAEDKHVRWLRSLNNDNLIKQGQIYYHGYIYTMALRDIAPPERITAPLNFQMLYKRYG